MNRRRASSPRAKSARNTPRHAPSRLRTAGDLAALALVAAHACLLWLMVRAGALPGALALAFLLLWGAAALVYAHDKRAARRQARRTPEWTLHLLELLGGWPGGLLAQRLLRHKNRKPGYQFAFWACVLLHEAMLGHAWRMLS